jgi:hypothetical protein
MNDLPTTCPICGETPIVTRTWCRACDTAIEGRFSVGGLTGLNREQLRFVETFVRCEGKFTRMEGELGLSYPTLRNRLHEIIRALGYEPGGEEPVEAAAADAALRRTVLAELEAGSIDATEALERLNRDGG